MLPPVKTNGPGLGNRDRPRACLDASRPPPNATAQVPGAIDTPYRCRSPRHARAVYLSYEYFPVCAIRVCILRHVSFLNPRIAHATAHFCKQSKFFRYGGTGGASSMRARIGIAVAHRRRPACRKGLRWRRCGRREPRLARLFVPALEIPFPSSGRGNLNHPTSRVIARAGAMSYESPRILHPARRALRAGSRDGISTADCMNR